MIQEINENNCPALRYVKWTRNLLEHPEFIRASKKPHEVIMREGDPFLSLAYKDREGEQIVLATAMDWGKLAEAFREDIWTTSMAYARGFEQASDSIYKHRVELYREMAGNVYSGMMVQTIKGEDPFVLLYDVDLVDAREETREGWVKGHFVLWHGTILMATGRRLVAGAWSDLDQKILKCTATPEFRQVMIKENGCVDAALVFTVLDNLVFRKYADLSVRDARIRAPKQKDGQDEKEDQYSVKSNVPSPIRRYDVNWYTETVRSAGFARKGFLGFRWKGPRGNQQRVLVPVKATWVKGYTRRARKPATEVTLKDFQTR